ncbi:MULTISPECIES: VOC family protein [unclassified Roseitalea]|uniref:VOC family protein n=1 Tax=unclassified Roseitalea TaxID=2639107 RepID=UPI00273ECB10|nr:MULTISPECIES: VOC family protein [unclassified Roseitalea]
MTAAPLLHASLAVDDLDGAIAFFERALGFATQLRADDLTDEVARLTRRDGLTVRLAQMSRAGDGCRLELIEFNDRDAVPAAGAGPVPLAHICFAVADLEATLADVRAAGAEPLGEIVTFPEGRCVYVRAPGAAVIEFEEIPDAVSANQTQTPQESA